jgi:hypothetical protein
MSARSLAAVTIATGALLLASAVPASGQSRGRCDARGAETILATKSARVFAVQIRGTNEARIYGCLYSRNRRWSLGVESECQGATQVSGFILAGRFLAYVESFCDLDTASDYVVVKDLRTGQDRFRAPAAGGAFASEGDPSTRVSDLALSRTGSVAWIGEWDANSNRAIGDPNDNRQVLKLEVGSPPGGTVLAEGVDIEPGSLGLSARTSAGVSRVYWTKAGAVGTSTLD